MPDTDDTRDLLDRIEAIDSRSILTEGVSLHDAADSLNDHFDGAFRLIPKLSNDLRDWVLQAKLTQALKSDAAHKHLNRFFSRDLSTPVTPEQCLRFYEVLAERVVSQVSAAPPGELLTSLPSTLPYSVASLAQTLWRWRACLSRRDCLLAATLLRYRYLPTHPMLSRPVSPMLELDDYLDLPAMVRHLLPPTASETSCHQLFQALGASFYNDSAELAAPAAQTLDALLLSRAFDEWAARLATAVAWPVSEANAPHYRALAEQSLLDALSPPAERRAGFILGFELFNPIHAQRPVPEIRQLLISSVKAALNLSNPLAQIASELLMRRFAPELLLEDYPFDFTYQPDIRWTLVRQGAAAALARQQPLTFERAEQPLPQAPSQDDSVLDEALRDTLAYWAQLTGVLAEPPPWSGQQWQLAYDHYLAAWDEEILGELPDRFEMARQYLQQAGINPEGHNVDGQQHLEQYLDHGEGYRRNPSLPDATARFEHAFDTWELDATARYESLLQRMLRHLPQDHQDRLSDGPWTAYAVTWPYYNGDGPQPGYGDSSPELWRMETATQGVLIHAPGESSDLLYELFPAQLHWRIHDVARADSPIDANSLHLDYRDYNDSDLPWAVADWPKLHRLIDAPAQQRLQALGDCYAKFIALGNRETLHALCKGTTHYELYLLKGQQTSTGRYLLKLFADIVPGLQCLVVQNAPGALACVLDLAGMAGAQLGAAARLFKPLAKRAAALKPGAKLARRALLSTARRWSEGPLPSEIYRQVTGPRRWHSAPELTSASPWLAEVPAQHAPVPGYTPPAVVFGRIPGRPVSPDWDQKYLPVLIARDTDRIDMLTHGMAYRYRPQEKNNVARRLLHEELPAKGPTIETPPYQPDLLPRIALRFSPPRIDAGTPLLGQQVSHAFETVRIEPAPIRFRPTGYKRDSWGQVMVREGKVVNYTRGAAKPLKAFPVDETQLAFGVISPPVYHKSISVEPSAELWFGLPPDVPAQYVEQITQYCPTVRLGGVARTVADRRTLRGAVVDWRGEQWLIVEADTGVFYGAPHTPWAWQQQWLTRPVTGKLPLAPRDSRRFFKRIKDDEAIEKYLEVSETYRIVASQPNLQRDIDNLTDLLRDWINLERSFEPQNRSVFMEFLEAAQARELPTYARNILTQTPAQDALAGLAKRGVMGLNREIIPEWRHLSEVGTIEKQHIVGILDELLSANPARPPYRPLTLAELLSDSGSRSLLREQLSGANLAFARLTLKDQTRFVYFSLSGGRRARKLNTPSGSMTPPVRYLNAHEIMQALPPDPRFTQLSTLRRVDMLSTREHLRHLDSERLIATVLNEHWLVRRHEVQSIEFFTVLDACRSCGGFVLPRLRLDYPKAKFNVTWLLPYDK